MDSTSIIAIAGFLGTVIVASVGAWVNWRTNNNQMTARKDELALQLDASEQELAIQLASESKKQERLALIAARQSGLDELRKSVAGAANVNRMIGRLGLSLLRQKRDNRSSSDLFTNELEAFNTLVTDLAQIANEVSFARNTIGDESLEKLVSDFADAINTATREFRPWMRLVRDKTGKSATNEDVEAVSRETSESVMVLRPLIRRINRRIESLLTGSPNIVDEKT